MVLPLFSFFFFLLLLLLLLFRGIFATTCKENRQIETGPPIIGFYAARYVNRISDLLAESRILIILTHDRPSCIIDTRTASNDNLFIFLFLFVSFAIVRILLGQSNRLESVKSNVYLVWLLEPLKS